MRALLVWSMMAVSAAGCNKLKPTPIVIPKAPADNPSILVDPPYPGKDQTGASPVFSKMSPVGTTSGTNDRIAGTYRSSGAYTLQRHDGADIDPEDVAEELRRWIESAPRIKVTGTTEDAPAPGTIRRTINYQTAGTVGYAGFVIEPAAPAKKIKYTFDIHERRR
jgi:hypothetical protein